MPCYQLIVFARPDLTPEKLAQLFRSVARVVYREHGQFRYVDNFGVRPLAYPLRKGGQAYEEVRWVQAQYDCAPSVLASVAAAIQAEKGVLQYKHLRAAGPLATFRARGPAEKLKRFSTAMRFNQDVFDPATLTVRAPDDVDVAGSSDGQQRHAGRQVQMR
jgi:ribosomal protein S6